MTESLWKFECPACRCPQFARVDERKPDGGYAPAFVIRCVECKRDYDTLQALTQLSRLQAENERLRAALDPFARVAAIQPPGCERWPDDKPNSEFSPTAWPRWGDYKRALAAAQEQGG